MTDTIYTTSPRPQPRTYEVTAWRPETYTTSDEFTAATPEEALALAKAAVEDDGGEHCSDVTEWEEFRVTLDGEDVLGECPQRDVTAKLLAALKLCYSMIRTDGKRCTSSG